MTNEFKILTHEDIGKLGDQELLDYCRAIISRLPETGVSPRGIVNYLDYYNTKHKSVLQDIVTMYAQLTPTLGNIYEVNSLYTEGWCTAVFKGHTTSSAEKKYIVELLDSEEVVTLPIQGTYFREAPERPDGYYIVRFKEETDEGIAYYEGGEWFTVGFADIWETHHFEYISDTPINLKENMTSNK